MRVQIGGDKGSFSEKLVKLLLNQVTLNVLCTFIIRFKVKNVETAQRQVSGFFFVCVSKTLFIYKNSNFNEVLLYYREFIFDNK